MFSIPSRKFLFSIVSEKYDQALSLLHLLLVMLQHLYCVFLFLGGGTPEPQISKHHTEKRAFSHRIYTLGTITIFSSCLRNLDRIAVLWFAARGRAAGYAAIIGTWRVAKQVRGTLPLLVHDYSGGVGSGWFHQLGARLLLQPRQIPRWLPGSGVSLRRTRAAVEECVDRPLCLSLPQ